MTNAISLVAKNMDLDIYNRHSYDLHIPDAIAFEVRNYLSAWEGKIKVVINAFTGSPERNLSREQLTQTIEMLNENSNNIVIIILDHKKELDVPLPCNVLINPFNSLHHVMELIKNVDLVISPDTSIVHISAAWKKPLISVYKNVTDNNDLWAPGYKEAIQIIVNKRKISDVRNVPEIILQETEKMGVLKNGTA